MQKREMGERYGERDGEDWNRGGIWIEGWGERDEGEIWRKGWVERDKERYWGGR